MDVEDFMGGIVRGMGVGVFAIECVVWQHRNAGTVQLCGPRHGCAEAPSVGCVGRTHTMDVRISWVGLYATWKCARGFLCEDWALAWSIVWALVYFMIVISK